MRTLCPVKARQGKSTPRKLARLDRERRRYGITLAMVAVEASKTSRRGTVGVPTVSRALSGDTKSANVIDTVKRLIAEARDSQQIEQQEKAS
jgi:hypothetical protein